jgi:hypothetical protein
LYCQKAGVMSLGGHLLWLCCWLLLLLLLLLLWRCGLLLRILLRLQLLLRRLLRIPLLRRQHLSALLRQLLLLLLLLLLIQLLHRQGCRKKAQGITCYCLAGRHYRLAGLICCNAQSWCGLQTLQ